MHKALLHFMIAVAVTFILAGSTSALVINEIMYNPAGNDNNREFVEILFAGGEENNITGYIAGDAASNDTLAVLQYLPSSLFALIVEDGFTYSGINASVYSAGATIGNNLNNDEDAVYLYYPNGTPADSVFYTSSTGGSGNGRSLERLANGSWAESITEGGTPGAANSAPCTPLLVNSTWSEGEINTICSLNDTSLRQRALVQYDLHLCTENETFIETRTEACDFCVPSWRAVNSSCREDDSILQWHNDSNSCYGQTGLESDRAGSGENATHALSCDFNNDGIIGTAAHINSSLTDLTIGRINDTISFTRNGTLFLQFPFPNRTLLLSGIFLERQSNSSGSGYLLINGIQAAKTAYLERNTGSNAVCVKDADVFSAGNISASCTAENETIVRCDGNPVSNNYGNYSCTLQNGTYNVTGLQHSGVMEFAIPEPEPDPSPAPPSGGDGGGGGGGSSDSQGKENEESSGNETSGGEKITAAENTNSKAGESREGDGKGPGNEKLPSGTAVRVFEIDFDDAAARATPLPVSDREHAAGSASGNALTGAVIGVVGKKSFLYAAALGILVIILGSATLWKKYRKGKEKNDGG